MSATRFGYSPRTLASALLGFCLLALSLVTPEAGAQNTDELIRKASAAIQSGKGKEAVDALTSAIGQSPNDPDLYALRARAYDSINKFDAAIADANKYIELKPDDIEGYLNRAKIYVAVEKYDQALADANKAITMAPDEPDGYYRRSDIYNDMGKKDLSKADEKKAEELEKAGRR